MASHASSTDFQHLFKLRQANINVKQRTKRTKTNAARKRIIKFCCMKELYYPNNVIQLNLYFSNGYDILIYFK